MDSVLAAPHLIAAVATVEARMRALGIPWLVRGGAGRALLGYRHTARDLDVEVPGSRVADAARALGVEATFQASGRRAGWRAAAAIGGVEVDLFADLAVERADGMGTMRADFALERAWGRTVLVAGRAVRVAPVEEEVVIAMASADWDKLGRIAAAAPAGARLRAAYLDLRLSTARASS